MQNSLSFLSSIFSFLWRQRVVLRFDIRRWQTSLSIQPWCSKNINHYIPSYLPSSKLTMISLVEHVFGLPEEEEAMLEGPLLTTKAGCLGTVSAVFLLWRMRNTLDMLGWSLRSSCTHKSPTLTRLKNSLVSHVWVCVWSIRSNTLSSFIIYKPGKNFWHWNVRFAVI